MTAAQPSPWAWDPDLVHELVLTHLGRFLGAIGTGRALSRLREPRWWGRVQLPDDVRHRHGLDAAADRESYLAVASRPLGFDILVLHLPTGEWREPGPDLAGDSFVSLAARRWGVSETKAAWRWARLCGFPVPRLP